jgi:hypothetical protein
MVSMIGYGNYLAVNYPGTWKRLQDLGSPLSVTVAGIAGRAVLAEIVTPHPLESNPVNYTTLGSEIRTFWLGIHTSAALGIVSPDARRGVLVAQVSPAVNAGSRVEVQQGAGKRAVVQSGPGSERVVYPVNGAGGELRIPVRLKRGVNHFGLAPLASAMTLPPGSPPGQEPAVVVTVLSFTAPGRSARGSK